MEAERAGKLDEAIALYERNAAEGFAGDLPYGRLVALYERRGAFDEAERVLRRAIDVFESSTREPAGPAIDDPRIQEPAEGAAQPARRARLRSLGAARPVRPVITRRGAYRRLRWAAGRAG